MWDPELETVPWSEIAKYWLPELNRQLEYLKSDPFYRERIGGIGEVRGLGELQELPALTKEDLRQAQEDAPPDRPLGRFQVAKTDDIVQVIASSGTTGRPVYYGVTAQDLQNWRDAIACFFFSAGLRREHRVGHLVHLAMVAGGEPYFEGMRHIGALVVWPGGFSTERVLDTLKHLRCNAFLSTTSYALHLGERYRQLTGGSARELGIKLVMAGGEPGLGEPAIRARVRELWDPEAVREMMGLADVLPGMWAECEAEGGMHFTAPRHVLVELVDPNTGSHLPWEPGVEGEPIYTTLHRQATPVLRYRSADYVRVEGVGCPCGRRSPKIRCIGRVDDMLIYRSMNVFPSAIRDVILSGFAEYLTGYIQHPRQVRFDTPIPVEVEVKAPSNTPEGLKAAIEEKVREKLQVRVDVRLVGPGSLPRTEYKTPLTRVEERK